MRHLHRVLMLLDRRRERILSELHPELRNRVEIVTEACSGRLTPWCGYRGPDEQERAWKTGKSHAHWGQSPHNYMPSLACDLVLQPGMVAVRERPDAPGWPDLWDVVTPEALRAWNALELAAANAGLVRVDVGGTRDLPHVQLPAWRTWLPGDPV